jgi:hypothetical protein
MRRILPIACVAFAFTVGLNAQTTGAGSSQGTTSGQTSTSSEKSSKAGKSGHAVTLTGCLREGDTPGTYQLTNVDMSSMGAKSGKGSHAHSGTATSGSTSGTETSGQAGMGSAGAITLIAGGSVNLKEHVGHKVQVTGTWAKAAGSGTPGAEGTSGYNAETRRNNLGSAASVGGSSAGSQVGGTSTPTSPGIGDAPTAMPEQTGSQAGSPSGSQSSKSPSASTMGNDMNGRQLNVTSLKHISETCQ